MKTIVYFLGLLLGSMTASAQDITGRIISQHDNRPLGGARVRLQKANLHIGTDASGAFSLRARQLPDTLIISYVGFQQKRIALSAQNLHLGNIHLAEDAATLQEVTVNTGYYQVARERATGSFTQVDNELLNRTVSTNILDRLEGLSSGLQFDRSNLSKENANSNQPELRIRGLGTIAGGAAPLIIVDNFPYEGEITSINPNDVESVTILKDAASASIWGARAGNGVIVINTKQGHFSQATKVSFSASANLLDKPDLYYNQDYLPSATAMAFQEELFNRGAYTEDDKTYIPTYAELLIKRRDNQISEAQFQAGKSTMQQTDFREQALRYLYQKGLNRQYAFNVSGGNSTYKYYLSTGYDQNKSNQVARSSDRLNINFQNTFQVRKDLELSGSMWYSLQDAENNSISYSGIGAGIREPYTRLVDEIGSALPAGYLARRQKYAEQALGNGLLDWLYRPVDELALTDNTSGSTELRINAGLKYSLLKHFHISATYQHLRGTTESQTLYDAESYYVRNLVNRFTQANGQLILPKGHILQGNAPGKSQGHSGRIQLNYNQNFSGGHQITVLGGVAKQASIPHCRHPVSACIITVKRFWVAPSSSIIRSLIR
jgi:TonB-dependent SusC/RagA subfamily outer membrane receptor